MGVWSKWEIDVDRTLSGPPISGRVAAATILTDSFTPKGLQNFNFFIIRPIEDERTRALLNANYTLVRFIRSRETICLNENPTDLGLTGQSIYESSYAGMKQFCFDIKDSDIESP